ncbi:MAG: pyruvate dehydrogenase (acetyl-transferring) E1 component subunit alpha [Proteobacteria bacterium]|nr:pyruvate dehydrogenase (acetyl-transferring) E1 component subunit alpha [Pseudomonadota bacterium]
MKTIAQFAIGYEQLLDAEGRACGDLPPFANDADAMRRMYSMMVLCRLFDTKAINLQRTGRLGTYAPCTGHEATHVAVGAAMRPEDVLCPVYREYGTQIWRGVTLTEILTYWAGDERGTDFAGPREDFPWCVPIGSQTPHAAGVAMAFKMRRQPRCAVAYIGDGGTSQGAFHEAINLAGAHRLPVVFVVVNNGWAISVPVAQQTAAQTFAQKGLGNGVPGVQCDGNDLLAVRKVMEDALERARSGEGPTVVEAVTYRLSDHTTADDASRYRPQGELDAAWQREPLLRTRRFMEQRGFWDESREAALRADCVAQIDAAGPRLPEPPRRRHRPHVRSPFRPSARRARGADAHRAPIRQDRITLDAPCNAGGRHQPRARARARR